jgi:hypothetical protein
MIFAYPFNGQYTGKLGVNATNLQAFVNVAKANYRWQILSKTGKWVNITSKSKYRDKYGWPTRDCKWIWDNRPFGEWWNKPDYYYISKMNGVYKGRFYGKAILQNGGGIWTIENQKYHSSTNITTFDLIIPKAPLHPNMNYGIVILNFLNTRRYPGGKTGTGIYRFRLICPGYALNTKKIFRTSYLKAYKIAEFSAIRFMPVMDINNNVAWSKTGPITQNWDSRIKSKNAYAGSIGWPWEYAIRLCNDTDMNMWINIPVAADDNYIYNLAKLLKKNLNPKLNIYIEYSNELWNWGFLQYSWNKARAVQDVKEGDKYLLNYDHIQNQKYCQEVWAQRRVAGRLKEIISIFGKVFGRNEINKRIRGVLAGQTANPDGFFIAGRLSGMLKYLKDTGTNPFDWIYAIAITDYYGDSAAHGAKGTESDTVNQILKSMKQSIAQQLTHRKRVIVLAEKYKLTGGAFAYEAGPDTGGGSTVNLKNRILAIFVPEQKNIYIENFSKYWWNLGGGLAMQFALANPYSRWGTYGLTNDVKNLNTSLFRAVYELVGEKINEY